MKRWLVLLLVVMAFGLHAQSPDTLFTQPLPQLANPFYDVFARSYLGAEAAGRGYTGASILGEATNLLINPATMVADSARIFMEVNIKPPINADGYAYPSRYSSPVPFGMVGVSMPLGERIGAAVVYNMPKAIVLDDFSIKINQGSDIVQRYPKYYLNQVTAALSFKAMSYLHLGIAAHNQIHYLDDVVFLRTYDRVRDYSYSLRVQPGLVLTSGTLSAGVSVTPPSNVDWDLKYASYDGLLPTQVNAGGSYETGSYRLAGDLEWENTAAIDPKFADRLSLRLGGERREGNLIYRLGYFFNSNVFEGRLMMPVNTTATADTSIFWNDVAVSVPIKNNAQHFLTGGIGYYFRDGSLNLSFIQTIVGEDKATQINMSLSIYLSSFKRKGYLYFDD